MFYGGARGGGKTDGLLGDAASRMQDYAKDFKGILFRRTYPELEEVITRSKDIFGKVWGPEAYQETSHTWTAPNGATLKLRYLDQDDDALHYQGHSYTWVGFDELTSWPRPDPVDKLWATLRSAAGVPCVRRSSGNPGGPGHTWVKQRYIDPAPAGTPFAYQPLVEQPHVKIQAVFIPATLDDNLILQQEDPEYETRLAAVGSKELYEAWRYGRWDVVVGAVFSEFRPDVHVLHPGFRVPRGWRWAGGMDWGYRNPGWLGLFAAGPDGDVALMLELPFKQETARRVGYTAGQLMAPYPVEYLAADEQMWQKVGTGSPTLAEEFQVGLADWYGRLEDCPPFVPATHGKGSRLIKVQLLHRYLRWAAGNDGKVLPWGRPRLRVHPSCRYWLQTVPTLPYAPTGNKAPMEDVDTAAEDHAYDGTGAYLTSRPPLPEVEPEPPPREQHPGFEGGRSHGQRRKPMAPWEKELRRQQEADKYQGALPHYRMPRTLQPLEDDDVL